VLTISGHALCCAAALLRLALIFPLGAYASYAEQNWSTIEKHEELQGGIYSPLIAQGEHYATKWGNFGCYWTVVAWILPAIFLPPFSIVVGLVDLTIAGFMTYSTYLQFGYSPHTEGRCYSFHDWQRLPGANESFFEAAVRLGNTTSAIETCQGFVQEWRTGIAVSVLCALVALLNIAHCIRACVISMREAHCQNRSYRKQLWDTAAQFPRLAIRFLLAWVYYLPAILFRCLVRSNSHCPCRPIRVGLFDIH
jgi:hypothetical protein